MPLDRWVSVPQADRAVSYASKLDDFESFVAHAKLGALALGPSPASLAAAAGPSSSSQQARVLQPLPLCNAVSEFPHEFALTLACQPT